MSTTKEFLPGDIDFLSAKETILKELSPLLHKDAKGNCQRLDIFPEKNEIKVSFSLKQLTKELIFDGIQIIKNYIENIRIHTFEQGLYTLQALNDNIFDSKSIVDNIRFRFIILKSQSRVEISKKGDFKRDELFSIIALFKYLNGEDAQNLQDPKEILTKLGVNVFDPAEEKLKDNLLDFDYIAGYASVKNEIMESIVMPIQSPDTFDEISKLTRKYPSKNRPRAVLFEGDPGVGKTTMARVVACLCNIPLVYVPLESILSKYYGESSQNLAYVFDAAALYPSSLLFLDEIDSLAGSRNDNMVEATRKLLSVLLRKLDGFEGKPKTITIGATNRKQDLDHALLSRFDKSIYFPLPDEKERTAILGNYAIHLSEKERHKIALELSGYSGRNIKDFCDYVERKWATVLIQKQLPPTQPPYHVYKEAVSLVKKSVV
ncbi:MAG: ATP-binding protein [Leptospiraceae bacterium]|nr:ATP-binding protein [Leptospiraceae bacterium]